MKKEFFRNVFKTYGVIAIIAGAIYYFLSFAVEFSDPRDAILQTRAISYFALGVLFFVVMKLYDIHNAIQNVNLKITEVIK